MAKEWQTFKTGITPKVLLYSSFPLVCSLLLIIFSGEAFRKFHPNDPLRPLFVGAPLVFGLFLLLALGFFFNYYLGRTIRVKGRLLEYKDSKVEFQVDIVKMAYSPPGEGRFKKIMVSDGKKFVQMPEIFLGREQFVVLAEHIRKNRERRRRPGTRTFSL